MPRLYTLVCLLLFGMFVSCEKKNHADLILHHGRIYTVDSAFGVVDAMAIRDGAILALGKNEDILKTYTADSLIDLQGKTVYPGFIDAHSHFSAYARGLFEVNLYGCKSWNDAVARVKEFAAQHPTEAWIHGRGWDQNLWETKVFPDGKLLTELFRTYPCYCIA